MGAKWYILGLQSYDSQAGQIMGFEDTERRLNIQIRTLAKKAYSGWEGRKKVGIREIEMNI